MNWETALAGAGIELAEPTPPVGRYATVVVDDGLAYTSGMLALAGPSLQVAHTGRLGADVSIEEARLAAREAMIRTFANLRGALGSLERIDRFVKLTGYVRAVPEFADLSAVLDGATGLLEDLGGPDLLPSRTSIGVAALPGGGCVEIDTLVRLNA